MDEADVRAALAAVLGAAPGRVDPVGDGWDHDTFDVDGELIVRFPRRDDCVGGLEAELRLLPELADRMPVAVPRPSISGVHAGRPFAGYARIAGDEMELEDLARPGVRHEIAEALHALHTFPADLARELLGVDGTVDEWLLIYRDIRVRFADEIAPALPSDVVDAVHASFEEFDRTARFEPALVHRDLGIEHVLVDRATRSVTGIIDFGDASVGDPAIDLTGLWNADRAAAADIARRRRMDTPDVLDRVWFYSWMGSVHAYFYGLEIGDRAIVDDAKIELARRLRQPRGLEP